MLDSFKAGLAFLTLRYSRKAIAPANFRAFNIKTLAAMSHAKQIQGAFPAKQCSLDAMSGVTSVKIPINLRPFTAMSASNGGPPAHVSEALQRSWQATADAQ